MQCSGAVHVAGEHVHQTLSPQVQLPVQYVEWGDGEEIGIERRRALAVREQYGSSDRHECGTQREGHSGPTESPRRLRCPRTGTERIGKQRRRGEPIGRRLGEGPRDRLLDGRSDRRAHRAHPRRGR